MFPLLWEGTFCPWVSQEKERGVYHWGCGRGRKAIKLEPVGLASCDLAPETGIHKVDQETSEIEASGESQHWCLEEDRRDACNKHLPELTQRRVSAQCSPQRKGDAQTGFEGLQEIEKARGLQEIEKACRGLETVCSSWDSVQKATGEWEGLWKIRNCQ